MWLFQDTETSERPKKSEQEIEIKKLKTIKLNDKIETENMKSIIGLYTIILIYIEFVLLRFTKAKTDFPTT